MTKVVTACRMCGGPLLIADSYLPGTVTACINPACRANVWIGMQKDAQVMPSDSARQPLDEVQHRAAAQGGLTRSSEAEEAAPQSGTPANARQYGGDHYKGVGYEHWDFVHACNMDYWQGCATKYITRNRRHSAGVVLNLEKAYHYVDKRQELEEKFSRMNQAMLVSSELSDYVAANQLNQQERDVIADIIEARWDEARGILQQMLAAAPRE